jgi:hypothetical protein
VVGRVIVIDSSLNPRLSTELNKRGRTAVRTAGLGLKAALDPELLSELAAFEDFILVTADDAMPGEHAQVTAETGATIATVDPRIHPEYGWDAWGAEVVHRWAHQIHTQPPGTARRYSLGRPRPWTSRRR